MPPVNQMILRTLRSQGDAVALLGLLGYDAKALPYDASAVGVDGDALRLNSDRSPAQGYGVLIAEVDSVPRSLRTFSKRLVEQFHDRPLALLGVRNGVTGWREVVVVRPRLIHAGGGSVSIAKLTIDVEHPTAHDAEVVSGLAWDARDPDAAHDRIDKALDAERVTRRFFEGLNGHYQSLLAAVTEAGEADAAVLAGLERAGGADRVALRIVTQILFCYFVQRKGLLEGDRAWLTRLFQTNLARGSYYQRVLEPLFYEALAKPVAVRTDEWRRDSLPFLNGGLFERHYGDVSLPIPDDVLSTDDGLIGFLDRWTFTVAEEAADESEIAVDPEMLGKIFESLIPENVLRKEGTVYTPRPVVQFMCREALVPYLERETGIDEDRARTLLLDDEALEHVTAERGSEEALALARRIDLAVDRIRVIDPAVGSGAFLLGMMSELIRLRGLCHRITAGREPAARELWLWKLNAIERSLFGVDINATAIELCRLRLWLSLLVEEESGTVHPLPNLEYRAVCADSLRDFVAGVEVQQTRSGALTLGFDLEDPDRLVALRERYFEASDASEKQRLRRELEDAEDDLVESIFGRAVENAREQAQARAKAAKEQGKAALEAQIPSLRLQFGRDRIFPAFLPAFHAPDVAQHGGWDVVIMNPPYVGRRQLPERFDTSYRADLERHYGRTYDLMLHFGFRAFELAGPGGAVAMIFNDSLFTSIDATEFRRVLLPTEDPAIRLVSVARTRCFEGKAVTGAVVVAVEEPPKNRTIRYVENHGRSPGELGAASAPAGHGCTRLGVGGSEIWINDRHPFLRLPHRPLFRPSVEAVRFLDRFEESAAWDQFGRLESTADAGSWSMISFMPSLRRWRHAAEHVGFYESLHERSRFVLLGLLVEGGPGLQTSDDRRFLAAVEGTVEAQRALETQARLEELVLAHGTARDLYRRLRAEGKSREEALLEVSANFTDRDLRWPRSGLIRVAKLTQLCARQPTPEEIQAGLEGVEIFVPFEKGDDAGEGGGSRWRRDNPFVVDWSTTSAELLGRRQTSGSNYRKPLLTNQALWGLGGVTWNRVTSYVRARLVPEGAIFGDMAPTLTPTVSWLSVEALLCILNAPIADFAIRTFLGSRMHVEASDLRRLPVPVLSESEAARLHALGQRAIAAKRAADVANPGESLSAIEAEIDGSVRDLYGVPRDAELWVAR